MFCYERAFAQADNVEASILKSGFAYVQAKVCDDNKQLIEGIATYNGSAGADINNILCATKTPIRFFKDHELLNKRDYYFIGSSQGGMQACNVAAHFDRATALILNVPWLSDIYGHEVCGRRENTMPKGVGVTYFDTAVAAQYLKCPVYIISGLGDCTCSAGTQMALFNAIKSPKYLEFY